MEKLKCELRTILWMTLVMGLSWFPGAKADLNDGLVAHYPFDGNANDESIAIKKFVTLGQERHKLSLDYISTHYGIQKNKPIIDPKMIVIHWTAIDTLRSSYNAMRSERLPSHRSGIRRGGALNVGVHFLVDRDGTIYQLMPETMFARHTIGLNLHAIGIENVGGNPSTPLTEAQLIANQRLVRWLKNKYKIEWLIGHFEYQKFRGTHLWLEKDSSYFTKKIDPGSEFITRLRKLVMELELKGPPTDK